MIVNTSTLHALYIGFKASFQGAFSGTNTVYKDLAMVVPSSTREETYAWLGTFPGMREWIGQRVINNLSLQSYAIKNKDFESTISIPRNDIEDDQVGVYSPMFSELGRTAALHPDQLIFELMKSAFSVKCYDGQNFFDTDHPVGDGANGGTVSVANTDGGSGAAWFLLDTSRAVRPFIWQQRKPYSLVRKDAESDDNVFLNKEFVYGVDSRANCGVGLWQLAWGSKQTLDGDRYAAARAAMSAFKDDQGKPLGIVPDTLVCGPSNERAARKLLNSDFVTAGVTNEWKGTAKLIVTPYLD